MMHPLICLIKLHIMKRDYKPLPRTCVQFVEMYKNNEIFLDLSFQRQACWPLSSKVNYIEGLLKGDYPGAFLLASIKSNKNIPYDNYFTPLAEEGYEYVSLDGNNRTVCLAEFFNDEFEVTPPGSPSLAKYSTLSGTDRTKLNDLMMTIISYSGVVKKDLSEIFINHNESEALRHQELRNARLFAISKYVREYEESIRSKIPVFRADNRYRRNDEHILDFICYQDDPNEMINKKRRDSIWYKSKDELNFDTKYLEDTFRLFIPFSKALNLGTKSLAGAFKDFGILRGIMNNYGKVSKNTELQLVEYLAEARNNLITSESLHELANDDRTKVRYNTIVQNPAEPFHFAMRVEVLSKIVDNAIENSGVKFVTPRSKLTQDEGIRFDLFFNQDKKCPVTGKTIDDPRDGSLWHVDHITPLSEGGDDDINNMQLVCATYNLKKGSSAA